MKRIINFFKCLTTLSLFFLMACKGKEGGLAPSIYDSIYGVTISPSTISLAVGNQQTFTASGGSGLYSYAIQSGSGSILSTTGAFTAPGVAGTTVVRVDDGAGKYADATITIVDTLIISPTAPSLSVNNTQQFSVTGGVAPITYSKVTGVGSVNSSGLYTAPATAGTATIRATDAVGNTADAVVSVFSGLGISPASVSLTVNDSSTFSAAGGTAPYTFSVFSGSGTINSSSGVYTAPATSGVATVRVTDSHGTTADSFVTIYDDLQISPTSQTVLISSVINFTASGGDENYSYSIVSGTGTIDSNTGDFTAPASSGTTVVRVTDGLGNSSNATVTITSQLYISPASVTLAVNNSQTFSGSGGLPPYTFSVVSGVGSINASSGAYTSGVSSGSAVVRITDSLGATTDALVTVNAALVIAPGLPTTSTSLGTIFFTASGGVAPFTYSVQSGGGSINSSTGQYTAPTSAGTDVVLVTDSFGNTDSTTVTIVVGLGINPAGVTIAANSTYTFVGLNGVPPYNFVVVSGAGSINSSTGLYTAPGTAGVAVLRVTDSIGDQAEGNVTINPVLQIAPTSKTLAVNNAFTFTSTGGVPPLSYSVVSGGVGTINSSSGVYTAPASAGAATVRVTDSQGATSDSTVTINAALSLAVNRSVISVVDTATFTASGGVSPYVYSLVSGSGAVNSSTGVYTPSSTGTVTVRVTDALNNTATQTTSVNAALAISPTTAYVIVNSDLSVTGTGGVPTFTYSIVAGSGSIDSATGVYTAPGTTGSATLRVTDSLSHTANAAVTIYNALTMTPTTVTLSANSSQTFTATGGVGTLTYSVYSGTGTIDSSTGAYVAPAVAGTEIVRVTDTIGNVVDATITVVASLTITPQTLKLPVFSTATFTSVLGTAPYTYSVFAGAGSVDSSTGVYTADSVVGTGTVRVTDAITNTSDAAVTHIEPVEIVSGSYHTCVRYDEGSVKCFGLGSSGQLGSGGTSILGDSAGEQGGGLIFVNLGTGRTAKQLAAGFNHTCAILDNNTLKCWGQNTYGQLGIGSTASKGSGAGQMGDNLPTVNLGTGRTANKVFAFGFETCVILDNNTTKCFGRNTYGQLALGDVTSRGTTAAQMTALATVNFGTGRTAVKITGGLDFMCALLDNATVKCFGRSNNGQLGYGNVNSIGDAATELGDLAAAVDVGTGRTVIDIASGYSHNCALLDNSTIKCWGRNQSGQLGIGNTSTKGSGASQMGDFLATVPLTSFTATKLYAGRQWSCASDASMNVRCWGYNANGQLLVGSTSNLGDGAGEVAALANINFGSSVTPSSLSFGYYFGCALTSNKRLKCWGSAANGALLNASTTTHLGDAGGELGDGLPWVNH